MAEAIINGLTNVPLSAANANLSSITRLGRRDNWKSAYDEAYNVQLQHPIGASTVLKLGYSGSVARHLQTPINTNTLNMILSASANAQANSPFPDFARGSTFITSAASTTFNGMQLSGCLNGSVRGSLRQI